MAAIVAIMDIGMEWFKQFWASISPQSLPPSFGLILLTIWEEMLFEDFQDGCHEGYLGYRNRTI